MEPKVMRNILIAIGSILLAVGIYATVFYSPNNESNEQCCSQEQSMDMPMDVQQDAAPVNNGADQNPF